MVASCLVKEPDKRPTASELLKHPFFKKARDEQFLRENLVSLAPSLTTRLKKPVRVPGASGRLCRGSEGHWQWVDDPEKTKPKEETTDEPGTNVNSTTNISNPDTAEPSSEPESQQPINSEIHAEPVNLNIRLRDSKNKLKDIQFTFNPKLDTPEKISQELVNAKLIDPRNATTITAGISTILEDRDHKIIRFKLDYAILPTGEPDESELYGYAQVSIFDPT